MPTFWGKRGVLQPAWRFSPDGVIWRIVLTKSNRIVGESRNPDRKTVAFFGLDAASGRTLWNGMTFGEQWWIGIEAASDDIVFLHKYATPSLPEHKSIIAVDSATGNVMWSNEDVKFEFLSENRLIASQRNLRGTLFHQLDVSSGSVVRNLTEAEMLALRHAPAPDNDGRMRTPRPLADDDVTSVIRHHAGADKAAESIEYLEHEGLAVVSYHEQGSSPPHEMPTVNCILKIVEKETGSLLFETTLHENVPSFTSESFFVNNNMLMFVIGHTTLTALDLTGLQPG